MLEEIRRGLANLLAGAPEMRAPRRPPRGYSTQRAMKRFVSCDPGSARLDAHTSHLPSGLIWGKPSNPGAEVIRSGSPPRLSTIQRSNSRGSAAPAFEL